MLVVKTGIEVLRQKSKSPTTGGGTPLKIQKLQDLSWPPKGRRQLKETGFLFEIGFDLLSLAPGQNGAILVLILDMIGSWRPGNFRVRVERVTSR